MLGADRVKAAVVDASVAVTWVVDEPHGEAAAAFLGRKIAWVAPRLMLVEVAAALRRKVTGRELDPSDVSGLLPCVPGSSCPASMPPHLTPVVAGA